MCEEMCDIVTWLSAVRIETSFACHVAIVVVSLEGAAASTLASIVPQIERRGSRGSSCRYACFEVPLYAS
jgi:hypothetical protein